MIQENLKVIFHLQLVQKVTSMFARLERERYNHTIHNKNLSIQLVDQFSVSIPPTQLCYLEIFLNLSRDSSLKKIIKINSQSKENLLEKMRAKYTEHSQSSQQPSIFCVLSPGDSSVGRLGTHIFITFERCLTQISLFQSSSILYLFHLSTICEIRCQYFMQRALQLFIFTWKQCPEKGK